MVFTKFGTYYLIVQRPERKATGYLKVYLFNLYYLILLSSRGGLVLEKWSNNRLLSATVDQIPLGAMIYILNKKD